MGRRAVPCRECPAACAVASSRLLIRCRSAQNVGWTYFLKALTWARKYGLRVNVDLHAVPGSQNGYNHSSKQGLINLVSRTVKCLY